MKLPISHCRLPIADGAWERRHPAGVPNITLHGSTVQRFNASTLQRFNGI
jgi:hypothetical protein